MDKAIHALLWIVTATTTVVLVMSLPVLPWIAGQVVAVCVMLPIIRRKYKEHLQTRKQQLRTSSLFMVIQLGAVLALLATYDMHHSDLWLVLCSICGAWNSQALIYLGATMVYKPKQSFVPIDPEAGLFVPAYRPVPAVSGWVLVSCFGVLMLLALWLLI